MKIKFSRITKGFTLAGLMFGLIPFVLSYIGSLNGGVRTFLHSLIPDEVVVLLCPPSLALMGLESEKAMSAIVEVWVSVVVINTLLYGFIGLIVSQIYRLIKKVTEPKAA